MDSPSPVPAPLKSFSADAPATTVAGLDQARLDAVGFNARHSTARGAYFVDAEQVAAMHARTIADLFRHVPVLLESPFSYRNKLLIGPTPCFVTYVDGLIRRGKGPSNLDTFTRVQDVIGAEVYPPGEQPPAPFASSSGDGSCTTVAIWTRPPRY